MNGTTELPGSCISTICLWSFGADETVSPIDINKYDEDMYM